MSIGERIKTARRMAAMSQEALASASGVCKMSISKYERGLMFPSSTVLIELAHALGVKTEFFLRPASAPLGTPNYRCSKKLKQKEKNVVLAHIREYLERYLEAELLLRQEPIFALPDTFARNVSRYDDTEAIALSLRAHWALGADPLENLTAVLEDRGIKVLLIEGPEEFDALTATMGGGTPVFAIRHGVPGDRQRFSLAHELGHLVLHISEGLDIERAVNRFAGAFLAPKPAVLFELGEKRHKLGISELHILKHKYGLSMFSWLHRAEELGIISKSAYKHLDGEVRGFYAEHHKEPGVGMQPEKPRRLEQLVLRALAEEGISDSRAAELLSLSLAEFRAKEAKLNAA